jgi:hypothetical protein
VAPAAVDRGRGSCGTGGRGSVHPTRLVPRGSWDPGQARPAPALPCRRLHRTSCGRGRRGFGASSFRCRPRPRAPPGRLPRPAERPRAGWRVSARVPVSMRCPYCPASVRPGVVAVRRRSLRVPARRSRNGAGARMRRPRCRPIHRRTTRLRRLGRGLHGHGLHDSAGGSTASPRTHRRPTVTGHRPCRLASPRPAPSDWRVPCPFRALSPERGSHSWAHAPAAPPVAVLVRGWPAHPRGRSAVGRSGGGRSQPAPVEAWLRSLDPSLLPSLGARGRSGSRDGGCGQAALLEECSVAHASTSVARRAEDLLVQPFVPVRGRAALPGDPLWDRPRRRAPPQLASSPISGGAGRLPARLGHVCPARITVLEMNRRSRAR